jgi:hypothetical protein
MLGPMRLPLAVALGSLLLAAPASAVTCPNWVRLGGEQRAATIDGMIQRVVRSQVAQQYNVSKQRVARCLERSAQRIEDDFDDACSDRRTAGMQALNNIFNKYVWSCVR